VHIGNAPPSPIAERPGSPRPGPDARWIDGYWDWDPSRGSFAWVTGTWIVPPAGEFWVNGYWRREAKGWFRVAGFWSKGGHVQKVSQVQEVALARPTAGPSLTRPEELIGIAPGADYFYIAGEYIPAWGGVVWRPGFWARSAPGWEWIPARWERRADAWVFREGFWNRVPGTTSPLPGGRLRTAGAPHASAPAGSGSPPPRTITSPAPPTNAVTTRDETDPEAAEAPQSGQEADETAQNDAAPKPADPKPASRPELPQQQPYAWYGPQPVYSPGSAALWNARSVIGGFLRQVLP
jgi:hypothetical protein